MLAWLVKQRLAGLLIINEMLLSIVGGCRVRTRACFRAAGLEVGVELRGGGGKLQAWDLACCVPA